MLMIVMVMVMVTNQSTRFVNTKGAFDGEKDGEKENGV